jgi:DNA repair photolyase
MSLELDLSFKSKLDVCCVEIRCAYCYIDKMNSRLVNVVSLQN